MFFVIEYNNTTVSNISTFKSKMDALDCIYSIMQGQKFVKDYWSDKWWNDSGRYLELKEFKPDDFVVYTQSNGYRVSAQVDEVNESYIVIHTIALPENKFKTVVTKIEKEMRVIGT